MTCPLLPTQTATNIDLPRSARFLQPGKRTRKDQQKTGSPGLRVPNADRLIRSCSLYSFGLPAYISRPALAFRNRPKVSPGVSLESGRIGVGCWAKVDETKSAANAGKTLTTVRMAGLCRCRTPRAARRSCQRWLACADGVETPPVEA